MFNRPRQQRFVGGAGQRAGDDVDLIGRDPPRPLLTTTGKESCFISSSTTQPPPCTITSEALMLLPVAVQRGKQTLQRFFTV